MKDELTTEQAAEYLGLSGARIRKLVSDKRLPCRKVGEGRRANYYFKKSDLDEFAAIPRPPGRPPKKQD